MFPYLILGLALLVGFVLIGRWFATADPAVLARVLKGSLIAVILVGGAFLAVTGKLVPAAILASTLVPLLLRWRAMAKRMKSAGGPSAGQSSTVETEFLRARLDHDSGAMTGEVLRGAFAGRRLEELNVEELGALRAECDGADPQAAAILDAYLERVRAAGEGEGAGAGNGASGRPSGGGAMTREEAFEVLGIAPGASDDEIKAAHRDLIRKLHPDQGGSTYLAAKINRAKDVLLGD